MRESTVSFLGGAGTVTGSNFLLRSNPEQGRGVQILIDCGLFQGEFSVGDANWEPFGFAVGDISHVVITHAHIDHIGRVPKLVKEGYRGRIISTKATKALAEPMLLDAMELLRRTAVKIGKEPLFDEHDIAQALSQWHTVDYHEHTALEDGMSLEFFNSGHILGSAFAKFSRDGRSIIFTGDLGGGNSPLLATCEDPGEVEYLVMESVYGDKTHPDKENRTELLKKVIEETVARQGTLLIPAFSTERTQDLIFDIRTLVHEKKIPSMPVYLDSPLAQKITESYLRHPGYFSDEMQGRIEGGENIFTFEGLTYVHDARESAEISSRPGPKIIIAGSGMSNGGRVVAHEARILPNKESTLLIVGYQAAGSLGRRLVEGAKKVLIHGAPVRVHCSIKTIYGYSAHMDGGQLLEFAGQAGKPEKVFVVMGEPASSAFLVQRIRDYLGLEAVMPEAGSSVKITL